MPSKSPDTFGRILTPLDGSSELDAAGDATTSHTEVMPQTFDPATLSYVDDLAEPEVRNAGSLTEYDALGRAFRTTDENGRVSESTFDARGLAIETRTESPTEDGNVVWLVSRTVYDTEGRAVYSTGSFPEDIWQTAPEQITGTYWVYDGPTPVPVDLNRNGTIDADETLGGTATGRMLASVQLIGLDIDLVGQASSLSSVLNSPGRIVSTSRSFYDANDRVTSTENDYGLRTQTLYDDNSRVIESRSEVVATDGTRGWLVSRTIHDAEGKVTASTDRFLLPGNTPLGEGTAPTELTVTIYDDRDRSIATERYTGAIVSPITLPPGGSSLSEGRAGFEITTPGTLETVSETLYDAAGRVHRTISGRVPYATAGEVAQRQSDALTNYPIYADAVDRYEGLTTGVITETLFDDRGRQFASLSHPLPAEDVGLGDAYPGQLVRHRTETFFNRNGQSFRQRSGLAQIESPTGELQTIADEQSIDTVNHYDAFGNVIRMDYVVGGTITGGTLAEPTERTEGALDSYVRTIFDDENRPVAEMQQTASNVIAMYDAGEQTFKVLSIDTSITSPYATTLQIGDRIPTKVYHYDSDDRLSGVSLGYVESDFTLPPGGSSLSEGRGRPTYHYGYDERGNQTSIVDPLGRQTRFTFTDRGQQETRTLPLGVATAAAGDFAEQFHYDDRGRQTRHVSFEDVVTENVHDSFGRMSAVNYYRSSGDFDAGLVSQRDEYEFDRYGRRTGWVRYAGTGGIGFQPVIVNQSIAADPNFTPTRSERTLHDARGRIVAETSPEGILGYEYDPAGQPTEVALYPTPQAYADNTPDRITTSGYDLLGRLVRITEDATPADPTDAPQSTTGYTFDLRGRSDVQTTSTPEGSVTTDHDFDQLGRLDTMSDTDAGGNVLASYDYEVRPDGRRTSLEETFRLEQSGIGFQPVSTRYSWQYDGLNRLTKEVIDHWDDAFDQTEAYGYDLTGNRESLTRDIGNDAINDTAITYYYDDNDRLLTEVLDDLTAADADTRTSYGYDHTQQTSKMVTAGSLPVSSQTLTYNLQGRLGEAIVDAHSASGVLQTRTRSTYEYDMRSFRVGQRLDNWNAQAGQFEFGSDTEFAVSHRNHTGYAQTLRETTTHADGSTETIDYIFGTDEIAQRTVERSSGGIITSDQTYVFGHDGHGSVRVLYDLAATGTNLIEAIATYSSYGVLLATHRGTGSVHASAFDGLSSLTYSGEAWDSVLNRGYNRARFYDASSAQWNRLDPFSGNMQDPQSLHKYAYVHGDPIQGIDPTGEFVARLAIGVVARLAPRLANAATSAAAGIAARGAISRIALNSALKFLKYADYTATITMFGGPFAFWIGQGPLSGKIAAIYSANGLAGATGVGQIYTRFYDDGYEIADDGGLQSAINSTGAGANWMIENAVASGVSIGDGWTRVQVKDFITTGEKPNLTKNFLGWRAALP